MLIFPVNILKKPELRKIWNFRCTYSKIFLIKNIFLTYYWWNLTRIRILKILQPTNVNFCLGKTCVETKYWVQLFVIIYSQLYFTFDSIRFKKNPWNHTTLITNIQFYVLERRKRCVEAKYWGQLFVGQLYFY